MNCKHKRKEADEDPCNKCKNCYNSMWESDKKNGDLDVDTLVKKIKKFSEKG